MQVKSSHCKIVPIYKVMEDFVGGICVPFHITNVAVICYKGQVIEA
jgi:hypothetical protein